MELVDFKQAYDTIPRQALWERTKSIRMPAPFLAATCMVALSMC